MKKIVWSLTLFLLIGSPAWAQDAIGFVKTVSGEAEVVSGGVSVKALEGTAVEMGSILRTGPQGAMGITFKDNTVISLGSDTELVVDEYLYAPAQDDLKFNTSMTKGSAQVVTGTIARLKPNSVTMKTPAGTIGIRGTRFLVKVEQ